MKKLLTIATLLAALLVAAVPALAQSEAPPPEEDINITPVGVLGDPYTEGEDPTVQYPLTDEITGTEYALAGIGDVDLASYVGQRVTIEGILAPALVGPDRPTPAFVNQIFPTGEPMKDSDGSSDGTLFRGTEGSDYLTDTEGNDTVYALGSGDTISSGYGDDALYGGAGWDYVVGGYGDDALYGGTGGDWLDGGAGSDLLEGGSGDDYVDGGTGNDLVIGNDGNDAVYGYEGSDTLYGGGGNDLVYSAGDGTADKVSGGPQYDICVVGAEDTVTGGCEEVYRY